MRAWAASNAFQLLGIACREVFTFSAWGEARAVLSQSTDLDTTNAERKGLLEFALRHFKKQHKRLVEDIDGSLTLYDPLFRCIMGTYPISDSNIFDTIAGQIIASPDHYPLRVNGKPGVGKTTFLTLLYLALYKLSTQRVDAPIPAYVNLKRYVNPERGKEHGWSSQAAADNDFAFLRKLLSPESSQNVIILLDGIDEYDRYDTAIETQLLDLIEQCSNAKKIVGVGLNYLPNRERFKRGLRRGLDNPTRQVTLEGLDVTESEKIAAFVKAFEPTYPHSKGGFDYHQEVIRRVKSFSLKSIDLLVISMLFDLIRDKARYEQADTLSAFFQIYCESFLQTEAGTETLDEAARLAFEYTVRPGALGSMDEYLHKRSWKLLHLHPNIRDFLVAWHAVQLVRSAANSSDGAKNADLNYVYPHNVNRFCKDIVNSNRDVQFDVLEGSKRIYRDGGENAKPHAVYLVGRFNDEGALGAARSWLRNLCIPEVVQIQERNDSELSFSDLLLCRTVYISLAVMNDSSASEAYIQILLDRPQWNDINRGFHLEYYGDIPFDPERQLSHSDILAPFPRTYHNLRERIESNLGNRKYGLFNIEVFTLYSLAQYRHSEGRLDDEVRQNLAEFIVEILKSKILSESVRNYLKMLQINFNEGPRFLPGRVADKLFMFKTQIRAGWVDRKLPLKRVESVADHTMGALILGLTYLPEGNPKHWPDYDKFQVLQYIMIHDLGESIAGDVAIHNPDAVHAKIREREAYCYLNMVRTYPAIADFSVYFKLWNRFEAGADENAKIARDIDKLENLVQLYIYSREVVVSDYAKWKEDLVCDIGTEAGKGILKIVQDYFEN
jgi:5'-deoxynucleotidase YfbR-like HD superfamily hydrolase